MMSGRNVDFLMSKAVWKFVVFRAEMTFKCSSVVRVGWAVKQIMYRIVHLLTGPA